MLQVGRRDDDAPNAPARSRLQRGSRRDLNLLLQPLTRSLLPVLATHPTRQAVTCFPRNSPAAIGHSRSLWGRAREWQLGTNWTKVPEVDQEAPIDLRPKSLLYILGDWGSWVRIPPLRPIFSQLETVRKRSRTSVCVRGANKSDPGGVLQTSKIHVACASTRSEPASAPGHSR